MTAIDGGDQVSHVQEGCTVQANVDERRLHAREHANHFTQIDIAHQAALKRAFNLKLLHGALLHHRHARFLGRPVDQDVLLHVDG